MLQNKVPQDVKDAAAALTGDRNFKKLLAWLDKGSELTRNQLEIDSGIDLTRNQGCAITLRKILKVFRGEEPD